MNFGRIRVAQDYKAVVERVISDAEDLQLFVVSIGPVDKMEGLKRCQFDCSPFPVVS